MAKIQELEDFKLSDAVKFNDTLNPAIWEDEKLKPDVREQLEKIARNFAEYLGVSDLKVEDITISGSNAAFTWTPHSDLDLHLLVDFSKLPDSNIYRELFNAKKMLYNDDHTITVKKIPVELYVQDTNEVHHSMGAYSVLNDEWINIPKKEKPNFDEAATKLKYEKLGELVELALKSKDLKKVENVLSIIKRYRKAGLEKTGEFGPENIAFKAVRKHGLIKKLFDLKKELESKDLSINENDYSSFRYYKNPTPRQLFTLTKNSKNKHMRGMYHNGKTYWWDANDAIQKMGAEILGLSYDYKKRLASAIDRVSGNYYVSGDDGVPKEIMQQYNTEELVESSGYIPSEKEKNDPRFKTALTKDVHPDTVKKNAKAFNWKTNRAGVPPEAKTNGKIHKIKKTLVNSIVTSYKNKSMTISEAISKMIKAELSYPYIVKLAESLVSGNKTFDDFYLVEAKDQKLVSQLNKLVNSYSIKNPKVGKKYIPVMFIMVGDNVQFFDVETNFPAVAPAQFGTLQQLETDFLIMNVNNKTKRYPNEMLSDLSYFSVILLDNETDYQKLRTHLSLQFDINLPDFTNDITENLMNEWEQFLAEEQQDLFPDYDKEHRAKRLDQWLLNTAVWDGNKPKIVYHATTKNFDQFNTRNKGFASVLGQSYEVDRHGAFFAEDPKFAEEFILSRGNSGHSKYKENAVIIPVYLSIQNPIDLTDQGLFDLVRDEKVVEAFENHGIDIVFIYRHMYEHLRWQLFDDDNGARFVNALKEIGFDGAVFNEETQHAKSGRVWVAFYPSQIKSAIGNRGSYSKDDPRITKESY